MHLSFRRCCFSIFFVICATLFSCVVSLLFCSGFVVLLLFRRCFIVVVLSFVLCHVVVVVDVVLLLCLLVRRCGNIAVLLFRLCCGIVDLLFRCFIVGTLLYCCFICVVVVLSFVLFCCVVLVLWLLCCGCCFVVVSVLWLLFPCCVVVVLWNLESVEKLRLCFLETSKFLLVGMGTPKGVPAKPQIEVCNQCFDGIWNPKNLKKHRFGPETSKSNPRMERV